MNELLLKRVHRALENLPDERLYQVLDYVEFLERKYSTGVRPASIVEKVAGEVEDTMRAARVPAAAIKGTMSAVETATGLMDRLSAAGKAALKELGESMEAREDEEKKTT